MILFFITGDREHPWMSHTDSIRIKNIMDDVRKQLGVHYDADDN